MNTGRGKLLFVVPLASSQSVICWSQAQQLFERTLRSICAQSSSRFQVVVACHERPQIGFDHPAVHYLEVDCPIPAENGIARRQDKKTKIRLALHHGRALGATHSMNVDADDCVSRRLAEYVSHHPLADGWTLRKGYFYSEKTGSLYLRRGDFYRWTGTSHIVRQGVFNMPGQLSASDLQDEAVLYDTYYVHHSKADLEFRQRGAKLHALPFAGAVYIVEHRSNLGAITESMYRLSGPLHRLKRTIFNSRRVTKRIRREFGLYELSG